MRELHVVGLSSDGKHLVLSTAKGSLKGAYLVAVPPLAKALAAEPKRPRRRTPDPAAAEPEPEPEPPPPPDPEPDPEPEPEPVPATRVESKLTPKEIQARLRAGHAPEKVARSAGVPVERVLRFSGPVWSERAQVVATVLEATMSRARLGASAAPLGESVLVNLAAKAAPAPAPDAWDAYRREDGSWVVRLAVAGRKGVRRAEWAWTPATRALTALDPLAAALGHVDAATARRARTRAARRPRAGRSGRA